MADWREGTPINKPFNAAAAAALLVAVACSAALGATAGPIAPLAISPLSAAQPFLEASQNIAATDFNFLSEVYFLVKSVKELDPSLAPLDAPLRAALVARLQALQNPDGGFGDWVGDRSRTGSTARAAEALAILGAAPLNTTGALAFLDSLQITGTVYANGGYRSSKVDRDADVSSTADALRAYVALGAPVLNATVVAAYLRAHQNTDGGFGLQTYRPTGIAWMSIATATYDGLKALAIVNATPDFPTEAVTFLRGLQNPDGGFGFNTGNQTSRTAYTFDALEGLAQLGGSPANPSAAVAFLQANQVPSGGFVENAVDPLEGLHTTFFAVRSLILLGAPPSAAPILAYVVGLVPSENDGGFGDHPGMVSNVRFTYDAIFALNALGKRPLDRAGAAQYLLSLRNADGGYGTAGLSSAESTSRALIALQLAGEPIPSPEESSRYLRALQNPDGGFASTPGAPSTVTHTYRALAALELLGDGPNSTATALNFLRGQQQADGGFSDAVGSTSTSVVLTWEAAVALKTLGALPSNVSAAAAYLAAAQNPDGGFRHAPTDTVAPSNFSAALYTYAAALALDAMGALPADHTAVDAYLLRLQSPDGAFADHANFTSSTSDTFSAIVALQTLQPGAYNTAPSLSALAAAPNPTNSTTGVVFSVTFTDADGQLPARIMLTVNGERHLMSPVDPGDLDTTDGKAYSVTRLLPIGNFSYTAFASDGFASATISSAPSVVEVRFDPGPVNQTNGTVPPNGTNGTTPPNGTNGTAPPNSTNTTPPGNQTNGTVPGGPPPVVFHPPEVSASVDPPAGAPTTEFHFVASYRQPEGVRPFYLRLQIDEGDWFDMALAAGTDPAAGLTYDFTWRLEEGNHTFRVVAFDGRNAVQTPYIAGPFVAPAGSIRPDAATFAAVEATIEARYEVAVTPLDVERGIFEGAFAWKVRVGPSVHFVSLDGSAVLDDPLPPTTNPAAPTAPTLSLPFLALLAAAGMAAAILLVAWRKRK
jgi:prenyltransferase beta subunit